MLQNLHTDAERGQKMEEKKEKSLTHTGPELPD